MAVSCGASPIGRRRAGGARGLAFGRTGPSSRSAFRRMAERRGAERDMTRWLIILGVVLHPGRAALALARQARPRAPARRHRDRARELPPVLPDHDLDPDQPRLVADPVAAEPLSWPGGRRVALACAHAHHRRQAQGPPLARAEGRCDPADRRSRARGPVRHPRSTARRRFATRPFSICSAAPARSGSRRTRGVPPRCC